MAPFQKRNDWENELPYSDGKHDPHQLPQRSACKDDLRRVRSWEIRLRKLDSRAAPQSVKSAAHVLYGFPRTGLGTLAAWELSPMPTWGPRCGSKGRGQSLSFPVCL
jgi:hypothetical protein